MGRTAGPTIRCHRFCPRKWTQWMGFGLQTGPIRRRPRAATFSTDPPRSSRGNRSRSWGNYGAKSALLSGAGFPLAAVSPDNRSAWCRIIAVSVIFSTPMAFSARSPRTSSSLVAAGWRPKTRISRPKSISVCFEPVASGGQSGCSGPELAWVSSGLRPASSRWLGVRSGFIDGTGKDCDRGARCRRIKLSSSAAHCFS